MLTRRQVIGSGGVAVALGAFGHSAQGATDDPAAIVTAIYIRAARGKGDSGGDFHDKSARAKYLSAAFAALWDRAEARAPKDEPGPVEFDPVTNSQDPDVKSFRVTSEKRNDDRATVASSIAGHHGKRDKAVDNVIRYDFVRENGTWRIDDIRGAADGEPWSIREILNESLKSPPEKR